jgi:hypothetical protein
MLSERIAELIQADVDGALDPSDRDELQTALEHSEVARAFRIEMQKLAGILESLPDLEPPMGLSRRILDSIELPAPRQVPLWLKNWLRPVSYGFAVAAGMLMAVGMVKLMPLADSDMSSLVGSMVKQGAGITDVLPDSALGQLGVDLDAVQGSILLKDLDGALALQFDLDSSEPVEVAVDLGHSGLEFGGIAQDTSGLAMFKVSGGNLRVMNEGTQKYVVFLKHSVSTNASDKKLGVKISQDKLTVFEGSIAFGG